MAKYLVNCGFFKVYKQTKFFLLGHEVKKFGEKMASFSYHFCMCKYAETNIIYASCV